MELIRRQQEFESRNFNEECRKILKACEERRCKGLSESEEVLAASEERKDDKFDEDHPCKIPPCTHDFASHDLRVRMYNKFGLLPLWYQEKQDFETLCWAIYDCCMARNCEPGCKHNAGSFDAVLETHTKNRFSLIPFWRREDSGPPQTGDSVEFKGNSLPYAPANPHGPIPEPHGPIPEPQRTPPWSPNHVYPRSPAWHPGSSDVWDPYWAIDNIKYSMYKNVDVTNYS